MSNHANPYELTQSGAMHMQNGDIHQALKDLVVANDAMRKIMEADPSIGNRNFYGITCLNLGSVYQQMQDFESFRDCARTGTNYLEGVLEERESLDTLFYLASVYLQLGQADEIQENYESAENWYKKAIERPSRTSTRRPPSTRSRPCPRSSSSSPASTRRWKKRRSTSRPSSARWT